MRLVSVAPETPTADTLQLRDVSLGASPHDYPTLDSSDPHIFVESAPTLLETSCRLFDQNHVLVTLFILSAVHTYIGVRLRAKARSPHTKKKQLGKLT